MSYTKTLAQLRSSVQIRWQIDSSPDLGDGSALGKSALNEMINDALIEAHDVFVQKWQDYYTTSATFTTVAGTDTYVLDAIATAADFYKLRVLLRQDGTRWRRVMPHDLEGSHHFVSTGTSRSRYRYRLQGDSLVLVPPPVAVDTLKIFYVKQAAQLAADGDSITWRVPVAQKLVLAIVGRDVLDRQDLDPSPAITRIEKLTKQLMDAADGIDAGEPFYIDVDGPPEDYEDWDY